MAGTFWEIAWALSEAAITFEPNRAVHDASVGTEWLSCHCYQATQDCSCSSSSQHRCWPQSTVQASGHGHMAPLQASGHSHMARLQASGYSHMATWHSYRPVATATWHGYRPVATATWPDGTASGHGHMAWLQASGHSHMAQPQATLQA